MIHFNFIISDEGAQAIFESIDDAVNLCYKKKLLTDTTPAEDRWYNERINYLKGLKHEMSNTRVQVPDPE